jgi:hypothetical protein
MAENLANVEMAHKLAEKGHELRGLGHHSTIGRRMEILEAVLLATVAVATAWAGYQSARWDGVSAERFAQVAVHMVESDEEAILGGQERLQDAATFNTWLLARATGDRALMQLLERRFSADYLPAFTAWRATDPFATPDAPAGPTSMPEYVNRLTQAGVAAREQMQAAFEEGRTSRETAEDYVRLTVFLATVLFLTAMAQRFHVRAVQVGLLACATVATLIILGVLTSYPRA